MSFLASFKVVRNRKKECDLVRQYFFFVSAPQAHGESSHIKTIVHIPYGKEMGPDPHHALYSPGKYAVDENFDRIDGPRTVNASYRRIALNHYPIKSLEEFKIKAIRGAVRLHA